MKPRKLFSLRNTSLFAFFISSVVFFAGCKKDSSVENLNPVASLTDSTLTAHTGASATEQLLAVSAYEGFGAVTTGGAGYSVVHVSNLSASGAGSLKAAIGSNRTIVFDVGGTISGFKFDGGNGDPNNIVNLTIDGSTAPSPGITLDNQNNGNCLGFEGTGNHDIIIKYIRTINAGNDGLHVANGPYRMIFDHCSSWGNRDGNFDITTGAHDITVQYCILGGGAPNTASYSGTMLLGYSPINISVHHNLFNPRSTGNVGERCPNVSDPGRSSLPNFLMADIRNNLMWKWGRNNGTGSGYATSCAYFATENCVNNYYYSTQSPTSATNMSDGYGGGSGSSKGYFAGNFSGNSGYNPNAISNATEYAIPASSKINMQSPCDAATIILAQAGVRYGNVPLSAAEQALINDVSLVNCAGGTTNQLPVVNAGTDKTITLPVSSVTLTGTASDPDGTIASYLWTKVSGTGGTITTSTAATTTVTGLTAGTYVFSLKVTDNAGATATDNITITVNPATTTNQFPVVNAGTDQTITLPVSSVTLTGTASDPDGTIASYLWTKVSGTGGTITTLAAISTTVTGLTAGTYVFSLKVTDNAGATATDNISVTVNPAATINQPPVVNAGTDQTITLPVSSVTLAGTASDPDGTIASYLWTKVSGTGGTITTSTAATTTITSLTAGSYVFNLRATDNQGATASDNITVTVNPVVQTGGAYGTLSFSEGYDASSSVNTNQGLRNSVSFTKFITGPGSFRSEVRAGDAPISGGSRSEMAYTATTQNPAEGVIEYDVYFENWSSLDGVGHTLEWLPGTSGAGALVSLQNYGGKFDVVRSIGGIYTSQSGTLMSCSSNTWYKMRWEFKWSSATDGYVRLYINNVLYYSFTGKTADGSGQKLKIGQARWPSSGNTMLTTSVCYYDNVKIYTK